MQRAVQVTVCGKPAQVGCGAVLTHSFLWCNRRGSDASAEEELYVMENHF